LKIEDDLVSGRLELPLGHWHSQEELRDSAVLALLVRRDGTDRLLFNRRRDDLPFHAGQICFPGGAREGGEDAVACAVRETCEETGLDPADVAVLGRLPDRVSIAGFKVACFAGRIREPRPYVLAEDEVAEAFEIPCASFLDGQRWGHRETVHPLARFRRVPFFRYEDRTVWGLTGIILRDFVTQVMGYAPPV